ncbi:class I SAM-dependent DNA methyltransferase, partial [Bosea vestrisii]
QFSMEKSPPNGSLLGGNQHQEALMLEGHTIDPHQFLGMEVNPRAAAIAELVVWIGFLQWHFRTKGAAPAEPILKDFRTIKAMDAVVAHDGKDLVLDASGKPETRTDAEGNRVEAYSYRNPRRPAWPEVDYIVGNPPFIGKGEPMRTAFGQGYLDALWSAHPHINESADFVMYWWDRAAELLTRKGSRLRRFGFVTTNSITQEFSRRVMAARLKAKKPVSIIMAIPDHPWTKATKDAAAVRIAMTVAVAGTREGVLREVTREAELGSDTPLIELTERVGDINPDLSVGADITGSVKLAANSGLSSNGFLLAGRGFVLTETEAGALGLGKRPELATLIRPYRNGRDLMTIPRGVMLIDLFGLTSEEVRGRFPEVYQHVLATVKPERDRNNRDSYRRNWWIFAEPRSELRPALGGLSRYIATPETAKHRVFQFVDGRILPDHMVVAVASTDGFHLGVLSSRTHVAWALRAGGWLGVGNDPRYSKSRVFDPFPFPAPAPELQDEIRSVAEELDAHRKARQAEHPHLTLTQMYNVLEKLRAGTPLGPDDERINAEGLVLILKELHDRLDALVSQAYGFPADLTDEEVIGRLVALNKERAAEEARGVVRWLRPAYQMARAGIVEEAAPRAAEDQGEMLLVAQAGAEQKPSFPSDEVARTAAVMAALASTPGTVEANAVAAGFRQGKRIEPHVRATLTSLVRMGFASSRDGKSYQLRRAA